MTRGQLTCELKLNVSLTVWRNKVNRGAKAKAMPREGIAMACHRHSLASSPSLTRAIVDRKSF